MEEREITLQLSREHKVRQRNSSKPWKRAGWWRAMHVLCASGSLQLQLGLQIPGSLTTVAGAGGQQGSPSPGQVSLQCLILLPSHPSFPALLRAGTHEGGAEGGGSRG